MEALNDKSGSFIHPKPHKVHVMQDRKFQTSSLSNKGTTPLPSLIPCLKHQQHTLKHQEHIHILSTFSLWEMEIGNKSKPYHNVV